MLHPFYAAYYAEPFRADLASLAVADLDTAEHLWGGPDYTRAFRNLLVGPPERRGETWQSWISGGAIELSEEPLFYVLQNSQRIGGNRIDRWALYAALDVNDKSLFIHEDVLPEGVERARQATEACESDLAPLFVGCEESLAKEFRGLLSGAVRGQAPLLEYKESTHSRHRVWPIRDAARAAKVRALFDGAPLFLLDGHHRLAAAQENYRLGMGDGRVLVCLCSMAASDTLILPIHRTVNFERWTLPDQMHADLVRAGCRLTDLPDVKVGGIGAFLERHQSPDPFCVVLHSYADAPTLVTLPKAVNQPPELASLAVSCLDFAVLNQFPQSTCIPAPALEGALEQLATDQAQAAFFLPPVTAREVRAIALAKLRMPRKSTRFVPKPSLGLVCRPWMTSG